MLPAFQENHVIEENKASNVSVNNRGNQTPRGTGGVG